MWTYGLVMLRKILSGTLIAVSLAWLSAPGPVSAVNNFSIEVSASGATVLLNGSATPNPRQLNVAVGDTITISLQEDSAGTDQGVRVNYSYSPPVIAPSSPSGSCGATSCDIGWGSNSGAIESETFTVLIADRDIFTINYFADVAFSATGNRQVQLGTSSPSSSTPPPSSPSSSSSSSQPVSLWRAALDPNGGVCADGGTRRDAEWMKMFVGYGYVPGASDCTRPGFTLSGWANVATPDTVRTLPSLIDPSDGKRRFFVAENVDLVAVWEPVVNPPATPSVFVGSLGLFCSDCGVFLLWNAPSDGSSVSVSDPSGAEVCVGATFSLGVWSLCVLPTGVAGTYSLTSQRDGATSLPITTTVA